MARFTTLVLLAMTSFVPAVLSAPVLGQEECVCQPMEGHTFSNSSLASCNKIAQDIQQWRALSFHSPYLADAFVDTEQRLQVSRNGKPFEHAHHPHKTGCHEGAQPRSTFDQAVRKLFRQWKNPSSQKTIISRRLSSGKATISRLLGPARPAWPWEQSDREDKSPGRAVDKKTTPAFLEATQRYRIMCRSKHASAESYGFTSQPELMLLSALVFVVFCMTILDLFLVAWKGYKWATQGPRECSVALGGDEKQIYAMPPSEKEEFDHAVTPAVSDL